MPVLLGGIERVRGATGGLYWLAIGIMATLAAPVWSACVPLLVEICR